MCGRFIGGGQFSAFGLGLVKVLTFAGAARTPDIHSLGPLFAEPLRVLVAVVAPNIALLVVFFVQLGDDSRNRIILVRRVHGDIPLTTQSYRLVYVHAVLNVAEIVHFRRLESKLLRA